MIPSSHNRRRSLWCSLIGGTVALALSILLRSLFDTKLLAEIALDGATDGPYPEGFSFLLRNLRELAKPLLFAGVLAGQLAIYVAIWRRTVSVRDDDAGFSGHALVAAFAASVSFLAITVALGLLFDARLGSRTTWPEYLLATLVTSTAFALTTRTLESLDATASAPSAENPGRRAFLAKAAALSIGIVAVYVVARQVSSATKGGVRGSTAGMPTPEVTANEDFYVISKNFIDPQVKGDSWRLRVSGAVPRQLDFDIEAIRALPAVEQYTTLQCISNEVNGELMGNALWKGVSMRDFLDLVQPLATGRYVWFESEDDYTESIPIEIARQEGVILAYEMNGKPLPHKHGFPLRLLAPGKYGMKQPKWITRMVLRNDLDQGYWSKRGWDTEADMNTSTRIDLPEGGETVLAPSYRVEGVAFSGRRRIQRVEVSIDGGKTWQDAVIKEPLSPYAWVLWHFDWPDIPESGAVDIRARATDGLGQVQTATKAAPFPRGATGYPSVFVKTGV